MVRTVKTFDLFAPWAKPQQAFWERWRAAMAGDVPSATSSTGLWSLAVEFWKAAIYGGLESQLTAAEIGKEWICANDANNPAITLGSCQTLHFVEDWTRAQMQLWDGWFAALESLTPGAPPRAEVDQVNDQPHHQARRQHATPHPKGHNGVLA